MSETLQTMPVDYSTAFEDMARRVKLNATEGFAGAFVIVPPDGEPSSTLLLDPSASPVMFWSSLKTRVDIALQEIADNERGAAPFGRNR